MLEIGKTRFLLILIILNEGKVTSKILLLTALDPTLYYITINYEISIIKIMKKYNRFVPIYHRLVIDYIL